MTKSKPKRVKIPLFILEDPLFMKALSVCKIDKLDPMEQVAYLTRRNAKMDYEATLDYAKEQGIEQGIEQGMDKGIEKLLNKNILTIEQIADTYDVTIEYVLKIQDRLNEIGQKPTTKTSKRGKLVANA
jgi:predicted transposase YdaD